MSYKSSGAALVAPFIFDGFYFELNRKSSSVGKNDVTTK